MSKNKAKVWKGTRITLLKKLIEKPDGSLSSAIAAQALKRYSVPAKPLQIKTVLHLARGRNVMLLAGTGFGKSRIPELFHDLIPKDSKGVVLVLNPLDALGDNQVMEKTNAGFTAINLTKLTFNAEEAVKIRKGDYNFVYLSPEIFLNSKLFSRVYFSSEFQSRLALVVVDEAHLIYHWGMVKSTRGRKSSSALGRHEDRGVFRPSYGNLGGHLLARNAAPILLLSATCPPAAVQAIQRNLKLDASTLVTLKGELTRPEIRIIRVYMKSSLTSCADLSNIYGPASVTPNNKIVPTLIYSGTRRRTGQVLEVLAGARGTPEEVSNARSTWARRYHSCTGDRDKEDAAQDFAAGIFPVVSCTMALGLGQNWTRVRMVVHMGRGDPSAICQMMGRCGRDGKPGLAVLFVEKTRVNGKNNISQFAHSGIQTSDDRMDALAVTPVCLRVAFAIDNRYGYIPLSTSDENYMVEKAREAEENFACCRCSNCMPTQAEILFESLSSMTLDNVDTMILEDISVESSWVKKKKPVTHRRTPTTPMEDADTVEIREQLLQVGTTWIAGKLSARSFIQPGDIFGKDQIDCMIERIEELRTEEDVRVAVGGHYIEGLVTQLHKVIEIFKDSDIYQNHYARVRAEEEDKYVKKTPYKHLDDNQKKRKAELKLIDAAIKSKKINPSKHAEV
ncbi:uncharacterized protein PGTG_08977 [Puccinia graminis f. sp. tritici CRL 75-36-700-3]|uniref:DNA 3'-5' helicase n=1 Tax=Puccinia graminis f. sp. tritici (strain CRL 75-36-700-3 / race SCCL) TaxID=418459 RepID=E3KES7_PUCGT|nr:uncharacterized protein PGTG_08977 [Puccinia graminis f. sp. tritici CRL 75-36-700-3]EFP82781.2 hypothetical protein PGTG_08977 [Puccinia graminis f. sp. tritici CRL 75-36-700-3]